jgi:hypothetical protein
MFEFSLALFTLSETEASLACSKFIELAAGRKWRQKLLTKF